MFVQLSSIVPESPQWLWEGRIAIGQITLLDGYPETNKSTLTTEIAARVSAGQPMPDGSPSVSGGVILVGTEDDPSATIHGRISAAGGSLDRVTIAESVALPGQLGALKAEAIKREARLVVFDPLSANFEAGISGEQQVRRTLVAIRDFAKEVGCAVLCIRHIAKSSPKGTPAAYRGLGSVGLPAFVRVAHIMAVHPENKQWRVFAPSKSNLSVRSPALVFEVIDRDGATGLEFRGTTPLVADELLDSSTAPIMGAAIKLLRESLCFQAREANEIYALARDSDVSRRTLQRAKAILGVVSRPNGFGGSIIWTLPEMDVE